MKVETRRLVSLEHAKTRGYVNLALHNTQMLHRSLTRFMWTSAALFFVLFSALFSLWWFGA